MKLVDTSVWIPFLRRKGEPGVKQHVANLIAASEAAYTCPVRFELIAGALDQEKPGVTKALSFSARIEMTRADWDLAADAANTLRAAGVTIHYPSKIPLRDHLRVMPGVAFPESFPPLVHQSANNSLLSIGRIPPGLAGAGGVGEATC